MPGDVLAARLAFEISFGLDRGLWFFHGKEKVYGSIP
jgi:hypothetical protein